MNTSRRHSTWLNTAALATWLAKKNKKAKKRKDPEELFNSCFEICVKEQDHTNHFY